MDYTRLQLVGHRLHVTKSLASKLNIDKDIMYQAVFDQAINLSFDLCNLEDMIVMQLSTMGYDLGEIEKLITKLETEGKV